MLITYKDQELLVKNIYTFTVYIVNPTTHLVNNLQFTTYVVGVN
jgi:hypothetical protein